MCLRRAVRQARSKLDWRATGRHGIPSSSPTSDAMRLTTTPARQLAPALLAASALALAPRGDDPLTALREVPSPAPAGAGQQNLAVGPDGRVFLSWIEQRPDSAHALRFAVLGGATWSAPRTVAEGRDWFVNWADFPAFAALSERDLAATWLTRSARGRYAYDLRLARSTDGGTTWTAGVVPHRDATATEHGFAALLAMPGGLAAAFWVDGRKYALPDSARHEMSLRLATLDARGQPSAETELDERICDCCQTAAAMTAEGPVVVYRDRSPDEIRDIAIVRHVNGAWTAPRTVADDGWRINACPVNGPAIAADGRGVAVAYYTAAGGPRRVKVAFSHDAGATFGPPLAVDDGRPAGRVAVVVLPDGAALVSWLEDTGAGAELRVRRVAPDGARGDAMVIARTTVARPSGFPRMVLAGDRVVFAWRDPDGSGGAVIHTAVGRLVSP
jgi:hypothetical protein